MAQNQALTAFAQKIAEKTPLSREAQNAFETIDRSLFIPSGLERLTYSLDALPIGAGQWISSPLTVAKMTSLLRVESADSVLEIGCGSGYQAAILSKLVRRVFTVERIERLLREARTRFKALDLHNINTRFGDGSDGWPQYAPFDRVLISCSIGGEVPKGLLDQLAIGGILVAPVGGVIRRFTKRSLGFREEDIEERAFVPLLSGTAPN
ncbi:MAG: protein-L-isoaspartate(D-aspartate) O-methyltransferase [Helicobacteraceae bacterium]|jgi:protein-L-isoaspartate(D-aspartate) O-methyltransferase|nr:protein-L-isoaspartate(D-aspartate) O-methyltransferase [Helicobacteraceae bacterium]